MAWTWVEGAAGAGLLSRERILARPGFNRWLVPPAALAVHLSIGMAYGFSVFWLPMGRLLPIAPACHTGFIAELTATDCNWTVAAVTPIFGTFIAVLGLSAAVFGGWVERVGPRASGFVAAACWGGGLLIGAAGVAIHQLWLVFLGAGLIGGIGQGLGYITPVTTLIRWFPDRRGMATGFAIMGYGGGAMIGSPLAVWLMSRLSGEDSPGIAPALAILGCVYFVAMSLGAFGFRVLPTDRPAPAPLKLHALITHRHVHVSRAWKTPQFWLLWAVLCANVTAGLALISMASPMFQDVFGGRLVGLPRGTLLDADQRAQVAVAAAGLVGLISLFNSLGRLFWASASDHIGRKRTYAIFFVLGAGLYACLPSLAHLGLAAAFVGAVCLIIAVYGGGFSTLPAYLADIFGTRFVGAIHGRVITAWSVAAVIGPAFIASLRQSQLHAGVPRVQVYDVTLYAMAVLMLVGLACNLLVRPVADTHCLEELAEPEAPATCATDIAARDERLGLVGVAAWLAVGVPFAIGLFIALQKAAALL
ncbi:MAG TPA: OFA family MFS transporter [Caulobacteraceae bacterium]|jgi:MFS family permease|nr:OFA family MFS transporter [Caulobacteraceae bacterium]